MFSKYYQEELTYLRELGKEFGQANPAMAGLLSERGTDPDVERLLEGFAFLTARIRERLEAGGQEIVAGLCELLLPHTLRTLPACSILELAPLPGALRTRSRIPVGTEVASRPIDGTSCRFRTTSPVDLLPLTIADVQLHRPSSSVATITLAMQSTASGVSSVFQPEGVRLCLAGDLPLTTTLLLWFLHHCRTVEVKGSRGNRAALPVSAISPCGFEPGDALTPWPPLALDGYRVLQEYFTLPAKFLFLDIRGLDRAAEAADERFEISFSFDRPPDLPAPLTREAFHLHCTPIVNLFEAPGDPVRLEQFGREHLVRASDIDPHHMEIYEVRSVTGRREGERQIRTHRPFFDFRHEAEAEAYYRLRRLPSAVDDGLDTFISLLTAQGVMPDGAEETLSLDLVCTNRSLATQLRTGDISVATPSSPTTARFRNIAPVSTPVRPAMGSELHWRLVSHLGIGQQSLTDVNVLRAALELYNVQNLAGQQAGWANQMRINSVRSVTTEAASRLTPEGPLRGARTIIEVDEAGFASKGDAYLFGMILDRVLASHVTMNAYSELWLRLQPSGTEYRWAPRSGRQAMM